MKYCLAKVRRRTTEPLTPAICVLSCIRDACANARRRYPYFTITRARVWQREPLSGGKSYEASPFPARAVILGMNCEDYLRTAGSAVVKLYIEHADLSLSFSESFDLLSLSLSLSLPLCENSFPSSGIISINSSNRSSLRRTIYKRLQRSGARMRARGI